MPIYEYKCNSCGKEFEIMQPITSNALEFCPKEFCDELEKGKGQVERKISKNVGLVFKGSGFYLTDYVHKNNSTANSNPNSDSKSTKRTENNVAKTDTATVDKKSESKTASI